MEAEDELITNYNRATEKIMSVFEDPIFSHGDEKMELEEVDFWPRQRTIKSLIDYTLFLSVGSWWAAWRDGGGCGVSLQYLE